MMKPRLIGVVLGLVLFVGSRVLFDFVPGSEVVVFGVLQKLPYILIALCVPLLLYFPPRYRKSQQLTDEGLRLLSRGHVVAALERFEASRPLARIKVIPTYNIGIARLQLWQLPAAERELSSLEARKDLVPLFRAGLYAALALVAALDGRLPLARQRLDEVEARKVGPFPLMALASAVVACRECRWGEARSLLDSPEARKLEGRLRGLRDALEAWCLESLTGRPYETEVLALLGEASPDSLQSAWPDLMAFVLERSRR